MTKRAVLYARVSSDDSRKDGRNLAGQLEMCREYAQARDFEIVAELREDDRGASGAAFELPQLNRVREMAAAGEFDVLIVREIDRLSRRLAKQLIVEEELKRAGVSIAYVLGEYAETPEGDLMKNLRASIAEYERLKIQERMTRGRVLKVKTGSVMMHGRPPYGYKTVQKGNLFLLEIDEAQARIVRLIFEWYTIGDGCGYPLSIAGIKRKLDAMQAPTYEDIHHVHEKKRKRGQWAPGSVAKILKNETYAGVWRYHRDVVEDDSLAVTVPSIVSREVWQQAQDRLAHNRQAKRRPARYRYLLTGRLYCGSCGSRMTANTAGRVKVQAYYMCRAKHHYARPCNMPLRFQARQIDAVTWQWVRSFLLDPAMLNEYLAAHREEREAASAPFRERQQVVEDLLKEHRVQLERLLDLYLSGDFPKDMLTERKTRLEATIAALERERAEILAQLNAHTLSQEQITDVLTLAREVATGLDVAEDDFGARRRLIELLNVRATLKIEGEEKALYLTCEIGQGRESIDPPHKDEERSRGATLVRRSLTAAASAVNPDPTR